METAERRRDVRSLTGTFRPTLPAESHWHVLLLPYLLLVKEGRPRGCRLVRPTSSLHPTVRVFRGPWRETQLRMKDEEKS